MKLYLGTLGTFFGNLASFGEAWEPLLGNLGNLYLGILGTLGTFTWESWEPLLGNFGNLYLGALGAFTWEPCACTWEPWEPLLGNLGNFGEIGFGEGARNLLGHLWTVRASDPSWPLNFRAFSQGPWLPERSRGCQGPCGGGAGQTGGQLNALGRDVEDLDMSRADLPWPAAKGYYEKNHRKSFVDVETSDLMMNG